MSDTPEKPKKQRDNIFRALSFSSQIGITMASCVLVGVWLGQFLDRRLGTSPWLLLLCCLLGVASAIKALFSIGKR